MADAPLFRSGAQARVRLDLLQLIARKPGLTYQGYATARGKAVATTGQLIRSFWEAGWVKPDRELPAHWTISPEGEKVLKDHAHLLA